MQKQISIELLVVVTIVYIVSFIAIGISILTIVTHTTTETVEKYTGQAHFNNLTVDGNLLVKGAGVFRNNFDSESMEVKNTIDSGALNVVDTKVKVGNTTLTSDMILGLKDQSQWFRVTLNSGDSLPHEVTDSAATQHIPFGRLLTLDNISASGPAKDHFTIIRQDDPFESDNAAFAKFLEPDIKSIWLVNGSFSVTWAPSSNPSEWAIPTSFDAQIFQGGEDVNYQSGNNIYVSEIVQNIDSNIIKNQTYTFPPSLFITPGPLPKGDGVGQFIGMNLTYFFPTTPAQTGIIVIKDWNFTFRQIYSEAI